MAHTLSKDMALPQPDPRPNSIPDVPRRGQDGLLGLPPEIREQIYDLVVLKSRDPCITMLPNHSSHKSEVSACQPALSVTNRQLREEVLPIFYSTNLFLAEVSWREDLDTAKRWLQSIGDRNAKCLRRLALGGWIRVPFGHMVGKRWVKVILDLKAGTMEMDEGSKEADRHPQVVKSLKDLKASFREVVEAREGLKCAWFDVESVGILMEGFHMLCTAY